MATDPFNDLFGGLFGRAGGYTPPTPETPAEHWAKHVRDLVDFRLSLDDFKSRWGSQIRHT